MGFKRTSDVIQVGFRVEESAPNTFTQQEVQLNLDPLNNEVFVILAVDLSPSPPDFIPANVTNATLSQVSSTSQTAITGLETATVIVRNESLIRSDGAGNISVGPFEHMQGEAPQAVLDYVHIVATPNFYVQVEGIGNAGIKAVAGRVWGYRAKADSGTYAALVQSEVLTN